MGEADISEVKTKNRILELEEQIKQRSEENEQLKESLNEQIKKNDSATRKLYKLSSTKSSRLQYFLTRSKRQFFKGSKEDKIAFWKWLLSEKTISDADRKFSPLIDIICELQGTVNPIILSEEYKIFSNLSRMDIITTEHTLFVAIQTQSILHKCNISSEIHVGNFEDFESIPYIIICPQFLEKLPDLYVVIQMEQTVSSRWMTNKYISILENAYAVLDYSLYNIEFFLKYKNISSKIYYLPITPESEYCCDNSPEENEYKYDVLFYGDDSSGRRKSFLKEIKKKFKVKVINNLFGDELYTELKKAKIVINVHYYENALLETTRLSEALSIGKCVIISEESENTIDENLFSDLVDFTPVGNQNAMINRISYWLENEDKRIEKVVNNKKLIHKYRQTEYYFERFLLANDVISFDLFYKNVSNYISFKSNRVCLSLPESLERRKAFLKQNAVEAELFNGLRHVAGWVGCALSYKFIAKRALEQEMEDILICEDDVFFDSDFGMRFQKIQKYMNMHRNWDVYSGIMADINEDFEILESKIEDGEQYVMLNKMISTVLNIYNGKALKIISMWNELDRDPLTNTIDRYLESRDLHVLMNYPFLVGHKEGLASTIWGSDNSQYSEMISKSSESLQKLLNKNINKE